MAFEDHFESTKALGVYNALRMVGHGREVGFSMSAGELQGFLAEHWDPKVDDLYVAIGISFLLERNFVILTERGISLARPSAKLKRADENRELVWA